jgi:signal transduction histidine kinase
MSNPDVFQFSVDSALLRELGEKLVSTVHVALAELIKNAFDADASEVRVSVVPNPSGGPTITIEDNGSGMTPEQVRNFWMRIGTTNKEAHPVSERFGRPKTGRKGVGRFACRRLGSRLELETIASTGKPSKSPHFVKTSIDFDWNRFQPGTSVESIDCTGLTQVLPGGQTTGTRLVISNADIDEWKQRGFDYLRRQLAVMAGNSGTKRMGYEEDPGFVIKLVTPDGSDQPKDLRDQIINASWGTVEGHIQPDGRAHFTLHAMGTGGKKVFTTGPRFEAIRGAQLKIGVVPQKKNDGVRDPKLLATYVLNRLIDEWGGVQIRQNGFRMYPYGNPGDDWLRIDADRGRRLGKPEAQELFEFASSLQKVDATRVLLTMLSMRNYFGHVDVPSGAAGLEPRIDRQGFVQTETSSEAFELLRQFTRMAIEWATIYRDSYIRQRESADARQAMEELVPVLKLDPKKADQDIVPRATKYLRKEIDRLVENLPEEEQAETRQSLSRTVKALEAINTDRLSQLRHLRLVASASTLTLLFAHEVRSSVASLGAGASRLRAIAKKIPEYKEELAEMSEQLGSTKGQLLRLVEMTGIVGAFQADQNPIDVNLFSAVERSISCFRLIIENYGIEVDLRGVNKTVQVGPIVEGEVYSILINLFSNAIKSMIASGEVKKCIRVRTEQIGKRIVLSIADNGIGLDAKYFADVFTPFVADPNGTLYDQLEENANPEDTAAFGTGSGLGLSIARDIARARGGDIRFTNPEDGWSACVEVELP